ncbi:hypothetical protein ISS40_04050 [Candidatus Bathyarchaeota archaeon]|nr:hypothetical protein [Candidatus Bathyarchaeota archaeon]MBL7167822.1 hypothetical protein [Candidatus Bathyarchaeota archaeon]
MIEESVCPKCGGRMVLGEVKYWLKSVSQGQMSPFVQQMPIQDLTSMAETETRAFFWEEKTGEKKGWLFKRDEVREMGLKGYRCVACSFIEFYAVER